MIYKHPYFNCSSEYFNIIEVTPETHTMGDSLEKYCEIKIHHDLHCNDINKVEIVGKFDRNSNVSLIEKKGKLFNYMRPTVSRHENKVVLECFPGQDYIIQFANVLSNYFKIKEREIDIEVHYPPEEECWKQLENSGIHSIPKARVVILGYVEGLEGLSSQDNWNGEGHFKWKVCDLINTDTLLLGCEHTYWGDIAGRIISYLANQGVESVIYSGKLGTLNELCIPNKSIATGNKSYLPGYGEVTWNNLFEDVKSDIVFHGNHITIPSVLQETLEWWENSKENIDFVDPEIGHMALAANMCNIEFSYFHIISDNLSLKFDANLSNERRIDILKRRKKLLEIIRSTIKDTLNKRYCL